GDDVVSLAIVAVGEADANVTKWLLAEPLPGHADQGRRIAAELRGAEIENDQGGMKRQRRQRDRQRMSSDAAHRLALRGGSNLILVEWGAHRTGFGMSRSPSAILADMCSRGKKLDEFDKVGFAAAERRPNVARGFNLATFGRRSAAAKYTSMAGQ